MSQVMPVLNLLSEYQCREVEWLWPGRVPIGKVTLLCGDPGVGKSMVTMDMAARVSRGLGWPEEGFLAEAQSTQREESGELGVGCGERAGREMGGLGDGEMGARVVERGQESTGHSKPVSSATTDTAHAKPVSSATTGSVLVLSGEDDPFDTIRPRVERAGGDAGQVVIMRGVKDYAGHYDVSLDTDVDAIGQALSRMQRARLVVVDPISAYLGRVNSYSNAAVRGVLSRLGDVAARWRVAVVCVTHINKTAGAAAAHRVMGSLAFAAAPRVVWRVARLVDGRMGMASVKSNIGGVLGPISFSIEGGRVAWSAGPCVMDVEEGAVSALEEACRFLRETLSGGARKAAEVIAEARRAGISEGTLKRAKGRWVWWRVMKARGGGGRGFGGWGEEMAINASHNA